MENMKKVSVQGESHKHAWEFKEILSSSGNGEWVLIPAGVEGVSETLKIAAGEGKIQRTTSPIADIENSIEVAIDWDKGSIVATDTDVSYPSTAIRQVNVSGTTTLLLRAQ